MSDDRGVMSTDDEDGEVYDIDDHEWPDLNRESDCGEHCLEWQVLALGKPTRIIERHCACPWCHGEDNN